MVKNLILANFDGTKMGETPLSRVISNSQVTEISWYNIVEAIVSPKKGFFLIYDAYPICENDWKFLWHRPKLFLETTLFCFESADYNTDSLWIVDSLAENVFTQLFTLSIWILKPLKHSGNSHSDFLLSQIGYVLQIYICK